MKGLNIVFFSQAGACWTYNEDEKECKMDPGCSVLACSADSIKVTVVNPGLLILIILISITGLVFFLFYPSLRIYNTGLSRF